MPAVLNPVTNGFKRCSKCGESRAVADFYAHQRGDGLSSHCKPCVRAAMRKPPRVIAARPCVQCGTDFVPKNRPEIAKYCSPQCGQTARRRRDGQRPARPAVVNGKKRCNTCGTWKPVADFTPRKNRGGAPISDCRPCMAARGRKYNASERGRSRRYALTYGVTLEWYEAKLQEQGGCCAICGTRPAARLAIDHCHVTGRPRGLLCFLCNSALGRFEDDPARLRKAIAYLEA